MRAACSRRSASPTSSSCSTRWARPSASASSSVLQRAAAGAVAGRCAAAAAGRRATTPARAPRCSRPCCVRRWATTARCGSSQARLSGRRARRAAGTARTAAPVMMDGGPGLMGGPGADGRARVDGARAGPCRPVLRTQVQLRDGHWARFDSELPPAAATLPWRLALTLGVLLVAVLLLSFVAVRWVTRPLHVLADGGRGPGPGHRPPGVARGRADRDPAGRARLQHHAEPPVALHPGPHPDAGGHVARPEDADHAHAAARRPDGRRGAAPALRGRPEGNGGHGHAHARVHARAGRQRGAPGRGRDGAAREPAVGQRGDGPHGAHRGAGERALCRAWCRCSSAAWPTWWTTPCSTATASRCRSRTRRNA